MSKLFNRDIIVADLRANGDSTAQEIADRTELAFSSITSTIRSLIYRKVVQVIGKVPLENGPGKARVYRLRKIKREASR